MLPSQDPTSYSALDSQVPNRPIQSNSTPLPPIDEVCRILARVLVRVQANGQADAPELP
jgi:hypothetical protein